ncbi:MAG TPA: PRC-barrel domain-containing protein [Dongiaceae bacterium]|jgi:sporulation protein YlmC with PRC-barrel domain|nr:PRC-barrel domain-containing protein [Dongiaceae bacterium]
MMKRLLMTTAAASLLAIGSAAYAQNATDNGAATQPAQPPVVQTPPANNNASGSGDNTANGGVISGSQPSPSAEAAPASPPPSDAVISAQSDGQLRADQLIGMTVYNDQGEKVGTVHDIILDKDGKATGVVLNVGGVLGIGAKAVGLTWKEIDVKPDQQAVQISYSKEQLKAAPDFKTTDQINAEMNAQTPSAPSGSGGLGNAPAPATQPTTNP